MKFLNLLFVGITLLFVLLGGASYAVTPNTTAPIGGTFTRNIEGEPPTIHPIMASDLYADRVNLYVHDTLANRNPETNEFEPRLAEKWETSKDQKVYTFFIRKDAVFHDGKPVTAEDVKFSYDAIFEPAYKAANLQPYYEGIAKVEVVDPKTVKFYLKDTYFQNFIAMASMTIIPKHVYGDVEKSKKMTKTGIGAGPYMLDKFEKGQRVVLKRFDKWYGFNTKEWKGSYNFATIVLRFVKEQAVSLEMVKKGELDYDELTAEHYVKNTEGAPWGVSVFKNKVENKSPKSYGFIGWNFRRDIFQDKNVRWALAHLMNREEMIQKFRYGMSVPATGPTYVQSEYASPKVKPIPFDPKKAGELLTKAGWKDTDKNGILDKTIKGKKTDFRFALMYANKDNEKYWTLYKEDLKKAGIEMELKYLEWNSFIKMLDEGNFDAIAMGWSTTFDWDPKQIWHSTNAIPGGSNFIAYKNTEVDKLIDVARLEPNKDKRLEKLRKVYELIAADAPYVFLFNDKFTFYANSNKIAKPADTFKFEIGYDYWWTKTP
jgi:peptide/nickel transport system substrate-binding protein/microcin C transport system substrate-binding protein